MLMLMLMLMMMMMLMLMLMLILILVLMDQTLVGKITTAVMSEWSFELAQVRGFQACFVGWLHSRLKFSNEYDEQPFKECWTLTGRVAKCRFF